MALTRKYQKNPVTVQVDPKQVAVKSVRQYFCETELYQKPAALGALLQYLNPVRAIVFCNTKRTVDELCAALNRSGIFAASLHGDMEQPQRTRVMNSFKSGKTQVLIATDVAARGIDVSDIDYVFNYDIPQNTEYYVHRIGRTGRAGKAGKSVTLCEGRKQTFLLMGLAKSIKTFIRPMELPTEEEVLSAQYQNNLKKIADLLQSGTVPEQFDTMVRDLMQEGFTAEAVAAAALSDNFRTSLKRADIRLEEHKEHQGRKRSSAERKTAVSAHAAKKGTNAGTAPQAKQQSASKSGGRRRKRKRGGNGEPSGATDRMANISYIGGYTHSRGGN